MKKMIGLFSILLISFTYTYSQPGQLDPSFGDDGKVTIQTLNDNTPRLQEGMAIQPDGKIVLVGSTVNRTFNRLHDFIVFRLLPNGKLDSSFGENGSVVIDYVPNQEQRDPSFDDFAKDVAIAPDGKIVVAGGTQRFHNGVWEYETLVVRLNPNGSRDISFDGDGIRAINLESGYEIAVAVSILSDGKILLAGRLAKIYNEDPFGAPLDMMVIKLKTDGQFDESFGLNGASIIDMGYSEKANAMIVQQDGKIIIGGDIYHSSTNNHDFAVVRLLADGNPDPSFSEDGILIFSINGSAQYEWVNSIAIQQDEKIVVTGYYQENNSSDADIPVARINKDGTFDYGFDFGGTKLIRINGSVEEAYVVLMDPRNNILIGAVAQQVPFGDYDFGVFRLTPEGNLDSRFDDDGKTYVNFGREDVFRSMQFQTDGKLVLGGTSEYPGPDRSYAIARLQYESNPLMVARATYIGPEILGTPCYGCQTAIIPLRATVTIPKQPNDAEPSSNDVRSAQVKFVDRNNNTDITGWITASKLIEPNDYSMATVDATWYVTLSYAQPVKKIIVGMVVDFGDSVRNDPADDAMITLYMPQNDVVSGGGELFVSSTSKGKYKANEGSVTMFGFYAQSKPGMPQPSGYMNMWFSGKNQTGNTVTYKLEINAIRGLGVNNSSLKPKNAEFQGTGKLWQQTGGSTRVLVEDNVTVHTKLVDGDNILPNEDALTVYIWSNSNVLIHTSNWFINKAVSQSLFHGQVTVHSGSSFDEGSSELITQRVTGKEIEKIHQKGFSVTVLNNPTRNAFSLNVKSTESNVYSIRVMDLSGRIIEFRNNVQVSKNLRLGSNYNKGMYFAEIRQGRHVKTIKLVKN